RLAAAMGQRRLRAEARQRRSHGHGENLSMVHANPPAARCERDGGKRSAWYGSFPLTGAWAQASATVNSRAMRLFPIGADNSASPAGIATMACGHSQEAPWNARFVSVIARG